MAPAPKPKSKGLQARLTAKVGFLPVWAWAAVILGAYLLYSRLHPAAATSSTGATTTTASTDPGNTTGGDTSGGVGSVGIDLSGVTAQLGANTDQVTALGQQLGQLGFSVDALSQQVASLPAQQAAPVSQGAPPGAAAAPGTPTGGGAAASPSPAPAPASAAATGHLTQTTAGSLQWGGLTFTTKAAFNKWAATHGTSATKEFAAHPQAKALYSTLQ